MISFIKLHIYLSNDHFLASLGYLKTKKTSLEKRDFLSYRAFYHPSPSTAAVVFLCQRQRRLQKSVRNLY